MTPAEIETQITQLETEHRQLAERLPVDLARYWQLPWKMMELRDQRAELTAQIAPGRDASGARVSNVVEA